MVGSLNKWQSNKYTKDGSPRAVVPFSNLKTLWLNTGTICNLSCSHCYIESTPTNDALSFLTKEDIIPFVEEIQNNSLEVKNINITGGEPFINPHIFSILEYLLENGFKVLVLTNAYSLPNLKFQKIKKLNTQFPGQLFLRISLDHYTLEIHEKERGHDTFDKTLKNFKILFEAGVHLSIAGRSLIKEDLTTARSGYQGLLNYFMIDLKLDHENLVIFPEMQQNDKTPEITNKCFEILNIAPKSLMCASERMIIKNKNANSPSVVACTLIAYDKNFELGKTLKESFSPVFLNHKFCSKFCVLGGASCS